MQSSRRWAWALAAAMMLSACGDGSNNSDSPTAMPELELFATAVQLATVEDEPLEFTLTVTAAASVPITPTVLVVTPPRHGSLAQAGNVFTYTPDPDFNGNDDLQFQGAAQGKTSNTARVTITVTPVNDPPVAEDLFVATSQGLPVMGMLAGSDPDGDTLSFDVVGGSSHGTVVLNAGTGAFTFTPDADFAGEAEFAYVASDGDSESDVATVTILVLDTEPPALNRVEIAAGAVTTTSTAVQVSLDFAADAAQMRVTGDVLTPDASWRSAAASLDVELTPGDGTKAVWVQVRDSFDNAGAWMGDTIVLDTSGPEAQFDYPEFTSTVTVTIQVDATDPSPPIQMQVAGDVTGASVATATYVAYQTPVTVFLTAGETTKTVSFQFRDQFLHTSGPFDLEMVLDQTPPSLAMTPSTDQTNLQLIALTLAWSDTAAPVTALTVRGDVITPQLLTAFNPGQATSGTTLTLVNLSGGDGIKTVTATAIDAAGNRSLPVIATVTLDTLPPALSAVTLAGAAAAVSDPSVTLQVTASGDAFEMRVTGDVGDAFAGQWLAFTPSTIVTLSSGDGLKTVWVDVRDALGNTTDPVSDTVQLDTTPPPAPAFVTAANLATDVVLTWAAVPDAILYWVYYDTDASGAPYAGTAAAQGLSPIAVAAPATSLTLTGWAAGVTVYVALRAEDHLGNRSGFSAEAQTTTTALPQLLGVEAPFAVYVTQAVELFRHDGAAAGERRGAALAPWGDGDGDGFLDGVIGAPGAAAGAGTVIGLAGLEVFATTGTEAGGALGTGLVAGADLDGDGISEVFAGAVSADGGGVNAGAVFALAGTDGSVLWRRDGDNVGSHWGAPLAVWPQGSSAWLAAAAPQAASGGDLKTGFVDVLLAQEGTHVARLWGDAAAAEFGAALAALAAPAGAHWLAVAAPGAAGGAGRVVVFDASLTGAVWSVTGAVSGERLGIALANVGDIDGDGIEDLAVGLASDSDGATDRGAVVLLSGADGSELWRAEGALAGDMFGAALAPAGDLDADNVGDIYVAAPGVNTLGGRFGRLYALSGRDASIILIYDGPTLSEAFGAALIGFDAQRNGRFLAGVGAPAAAFNGSDSGRLYVLAPTGPMRAAAPATTVTFAVRGNATVVGVDVRVDAGSWEAAADPLYPQVTGLTPGGPHIIELRPRDAKGVVGATTVQVWSVDVTPPTTAIWQPVMAVTSSTTVTGTVTDTTDLDGVGGLVGGIEWAAKLVTAPADLWWDGEAYTWPEPRWFFAATTEVWSFNAPFTGPGTFEVRVRGLDGSYLRTPAPATVSVTYLP